MNVVSGTRTVLTNKLAALTTKISWQTARAQLN